MKKNKKILLVFVLGMILGGTLFVLEVFGITSKTATITAMMITLSLAFYIVSNEVTPIVFAMGMWSAVVGLFLLMAPLAGVLVIAKKIKG